MECFIVLIFFALLAVLASGVGLGLGPQTSRGAYQALTRRFGGTFQRGGVVRRPTVRFRYGQTSVTVSPGPKRGQTRTTLAVLQWGDSTTDVRVEASASFDDSQRQSDIVVGDEEFDRRFYVSGRSEEDVRKLLSDGVRWQINKLCQFFDCPFISFTIRSNRMAIEKPVLFRRSEDLEQFTQLCLELYDQAMLTRSEGIEFMGGGDEAQLVEEPICQICGEAIVSEMVFCRRCRTPHHLDCWQYAGACSVYGCRETRYALPTIARPINTRDDAALDDAALDDAESGADAT